MPTPAEQEIYGFLTTMYGENEGIVYAPTKGESAKSFIRYYFEWPEQRDDVIQHMVQANQQGKDAWVAPALLKSKRDGKKNNWLGTQFLYVDFDEGVPSKLPAEIPEPTIKIQSSVAGREHWYWKLDKFYTGDDNRKAIEQLQKSLTYALGADKGGWDATQVMRAPGTKHRKQGVITRLLNHESARVYDLVAFKDLVTAPPSEKVQLKTELRDLPDIVEVLSSGRVKKLSQDAYEIINRPPGFDQDRSGALWKLAMECLEVRPPVLKSDILTLLWHVEKRVNKFGDRSSSEAEHFLYIKRLLQEAMGVKQLDPQAVDDDPAEQYADLEFLTIDQMLQRQTVTFDWIYEKHIAKGTFNVLASLGGVGKTSLAMQLGMHMASATPFLEVPNALQRPVKNVIFSFEMPEQIFNAYAGTIYKNFAPAERELISKNWFRSGLGYKVSLWDPEIQDYILQQIAKHNPEVIFIDSVKYAGGMDEKKADELYTWIKKDILSKLNISVYFIHHLRKSPNEKPNQEPQSIDDLYGDAYIGNIADSLTYLWRPPVGDNHLLKVRQVKARTHSLLDPFFLRRTESLYYVLDQTVDNPVAQSNNGGGGLFA